MVHKNILNTLIVKKRYVLFLCVCKRAEVKDFYLKHLIPQI